MKNKLFFSIIFLFLFSCSEYKEQQELPTNKGISKINNKVTESILYKESSIYGNFIADGGELAGYSSLKDNSLADEQFSYMITTPEKSLKSGGSDIIVNLIANGHNLSNISKLKSTLKSANQRLYKDIYGCNVSFLVKTKGTLKSSSAENADTISMYIPKLVEITSPKIETQQDLYPYCYFDRFKIKWNADNNNKNGLVVIVEWLGTSITGVKSDIYIRNIDVLPNDTGEAILNSKLFDNIPEKAITYITLLRGNISFANISNIPYRVYGESHVVLPMILIRKLTK